MTGKYETLTCMLNQDVLYIVVNLCYIVDIMVIDKTDSLDSQTFESDEEFSSFEEESVEEVTALETEEIFFEPQPSPPTPLPPLPLPILVREPTPPPAPTPQLPCVSFKLNFFSTISFLF